LMGADIGSHFFWLLFFGRNPKKSNPPSGRNRGFTKRGQ
jgi:hypothetical protein